MTTFPRLSRATHRCVDGQESSVRLPELPRWKIVHLGSSGSLTELSCPSTHLCVARDSLGNVVMTTTPTGDASAWTAQPLDIEGRITSLACPSAHACVAADEAGNVLLGVVPR